MAELNAAGQIVTLDRDGNAQNDVVDQDAAAAEGTINNDNKHIDLLQTLPEEVIARIASYLRNDLHAPRLACKALRDGSQYVWNDRYARSLRVQLVPRDIQHIQSLLGPSGCLGQVKDLSFIEPYTRLSTGSSGGDQIMAVGAFIQKFSTVRTIEVQSRGGYPCDGTVPLCQAAEMLRALSTAGSETLEKIVLRSGVYSASLLCSLLQSVAVSLRSLAITAVGICDDTLYSVLALIRDRLRVNELQVYGVCHISKSECEHVFTRSFEMGGQCEHKWLRGNLGGRLEHYTLGWNRLDAKGECAVKIALNKVLQLEGSDLYDVGILGRTRSKGVREYVV